MNNRIEIIKLVPIGGSVMEVGTLEGGFALEIANTRPDIVLFCVDSWMAPHSHCEEIARTRLEGKATIIKMDSLEASRLGRGFDLVYLDAGHTYKVVLDDLQAWWSNVRSGGILAGHDYETKPMGKWHTAIEVEEAVNDWAKPMGLTINVTDEDCPSFWIRKP